MDLERIINSPNRIIGYKQVMRGLKEGAVTAVALAGDTDKVMRAEIIRACRGRDIKIAGVRSKAELGAMCGIDVGCAVCGANIKNN